MNVFVALVPIFLEGPEQNSDAHRRLALRLAAELTTEAAAALKAFLAVTPVDEALLPGIYATLRLLHCRALPPAADGDKPALAAAFFGAGIPASAAACVLGPYSELCLSADFGVGATYVLEAALEAWRQTTTLVRISSAEAETFVGAALAAMQASLTPPGARAAGAWDPRGLPTVFNGAKIIQHLSRGGGGTWQSTALVASAFDVLFPALLSLAQQPPLVADAVLIALMSLEGREDHGGRALLIRRISKQGPSLGSRPGAPTPAVLENLVAAMRCFPSAPAVQHAGCSLLLSVVTHGAPEARARAIGVSGGLEAAVEAINGEQRHRPGDAETTLRACELLDAATRAREGGAARLLAASAVVCLVRLAARGSRPGEPDEAAGLKHVTTSILALSSACRRQGQPSEQDAAAAVQNANDALAAGVLDVLQAAVRKYAGPASKSLGVRFMDGEQTALLDFSAALLLALCWRGGAAANAPQPVASHPVVLETFRLLEACAPAGNALVEWRLFALELEIDLVDILKRDAPLRAAGRRNGLREANAVRDSWLLRAQDMIDIGAELQEPVPSEAELVQRFPPAGASGTAADGVSGGGDSTPATAAPGAGAVQDERRRGGDGRMKQRQPGRQQGGSVATGDDSSSDPQQRADSPPGGNGEKERSRAAAARSEGALSSGGPSTAPALPQSSSADVGTAAGVQRQRKPKKKACLHCAGTEGLQRCSGCLRRWLCSEACSRAAWKAGHKEECALLQERRQKKRQDQRHAEHKSGGVGGSGGEQSSSRASPPPAALSEQTVFVDLVDEAAFDAQQRQALLDLVEGARWAEQREFSLY